MATPELRYDPRLGDDSERYLHCSREQWNSASEGMKKVFHNVALMVFSEGARPHHPCQQCLDYGIKTECVVWHPDVVDKKTMALGKCAPCYRKRKLCNVEIGVSVERIHSPRSITSALSEELDSTASEIAVATSSAKAQFLAKCDEGRAALTRVEELMHGLDEDREDYHRRVHETVEKMLQPLRMQLWEAFMDVVASDAVQQARVPVTKPSALFKDLKQLCEALPTDDSRLNRMADAIDHFIAELSFNLWVAYLDPCI